VIRAQLGGLDAGAFAFVMATGIVSIAAFIYRFFALSDVLFAITCAAWVVLAVTVLLRTANSPRRRPRLQSFALVAATAVIGARFALIDDAVFALALWSLAALLWLLLIVQRPTIETAAGASLLAVVAPESLAVLAALLARRETAVLVDVSLAGWLLGLVAYPLLVWQIALNLRNQLKPAPDLWVAMGALAIATLAGAELMLAARERHMLSGLVRALPDIDLATWSLASFLIVPLAALDVRVRSGWRYSAERWSFVFPLGMYAVASSTLARADKLSFSSTLGRAAFLVALAMWALTLLGLVRRGVLSFHERSHG
jgi:tellurite resistance protein TehA-like permease